IGLGPQPCFSNSVVELSLGAGSRLTHVMVQEEAQQGVHVSTTGVRLGQGAICDSFILNAGGRLVRREVHTVFADTGGEFRIQGAYLVHGGQHSDITTLIDHRSPGCTSHEVIKGVIDGNGRAVFQGKIHVAPGAQKTDGYQLNRALLLSDAAEIDSKPELEIHADDVKCSHGATAGELDDQALFYLRSRGIDETTARHLLVQAFLAEVVDGIRDENIRAAISGVVGRHMAG
ncbi:MAG: Fe-S cluster assembly protein SufD, partial [Pseudomonadota bacterium]|nr:Fe-S cluster assembly protein SufD [Pseudomonadota bacterium]